MSSDVAREEKTPEVLGSSGARYTVGRAIPHRVHACRADSASPGLIVIGRSPARNYEKKSGHGRPDSKSKEAANDLNQGPARALSAGPN